MAKVSSNPIVLAIKKQLGIIEPLGFQPNGNLEVQCLYLIVQASENVKLGTLIDHTPILVPIGLVEKTGYRYLIPIGNTHIPGLFGLDLNLLFSSDPKEEQFLVKFKNELVTNIIKFSKAKTEKEKVTFRELIKIQLKTLWFDKTQKPFIHIDLRRIKFQRRLDLLVNSEETSGVDHSMDNKLLTMLRQFVPTMSMF